ncbi:hypothetical protein N7504_009213 [Penicillium tannophilum]|nr:hypothetical protein N7504_009213 [Penicillium tannophilum]
MSISHSHRDLTNPTSAMLVSRRRRSDINLLSTRGLISCSYRNALTIPIYPPKPTSCQPLWKPLRTFEVPAHFLKKHKMQMLEATLEPDWMSTVVVEKPRAHLDALPIELLEMVAKFLLPVDLLCLSLCSKWLHGSFPKVQFYNFGYDEAIFLDFLDRLARDEPHHYICKSCHRLHRIEYVQLPGPLCKPPSCYETPSKLALNHWNKKDHYLFLDQPLILIQFPSYTQYKFYFVHLQLAMRRFMYGPGFGIPIESLFYTEVATSPIAKDSNTINPQLEVSRITDDEVQLNTQTTLFSVEARICADPPSFCMRSQEMAVVCREKALTLLPNPFADSIRICLHISTAGSGDLFIWNRVSELVKQYHCGERGKYLTAQGRCPRCNTAWKAQVREIEPNDVSLVITRWMSLGAGLDPEDPMWRSFIESKHYLPFDTVAADPRVLFEMDSVQARSGSALSEEALFLRNSELLRAGNYRESMSELDGQRWIMTPEE